MKQNSADSAATTIKTIIRAITIFGTIATIAGAFTEYLSYKASEQQAHAANLEFSLKMSEKFFTIKENVRYLKNTFTMVSLKLENNDYRKRAEEIADTLEVISVFANNEMIGKELMLVWGDFYDDTVKEIQDYIQSRSDGTPEGSSNHNAYSEIKKTCENFNLKCGSQGWNGNRQLANREFTY